MNGTGVVGHDHVPTDQQWRCIHPRARFRGPSLDACGKGQGMDDAVPRDRVDHTFFDRRRRREPTARLITPTDGRHARGPGTWHHTGPGRVAAIGQDGSRAGRRWVQVTGHGGQIGRRRLHRGVGHRRGAARDDDHRAGEDRRYWSPESFSIHAEPSKCGCVACETRATAARLGWVIRGLRHPRSGPGCI